MPSPSNVHQKGILHHWRNLTGPNYLLSPNQNKMCNWTSHQTMPRFVQVKHFWRTNRLFTGTWTSFSGRCGQYRRWVLGRLRERSSWSRCWLSVSWEVGVGVGLRVGLGVGFDVGVGVGFDVGVGVQILFSVSSCRFFVGGRLSFDVFCPPVYPIPVRSSATGLPNLVSSEGNSLVTWVTADSLPCLERVRSMRILYFYITGYASILLYSLPLKRFFWKCSLISDSGDGWDFDSAETNRGPALVLNSSGSGTTNR